MPYAVIIRYSAAAALFALGAAGLWLAVRLGFVRRKWERVDGLRLATVAYLAALVEIIGLRLGLRVLCPLGGEVRLMPLATTLGHWRLGPGAFVYHALGNLAWFVPLGWLLPRLRTRCHWFHVALAGAALSLGVEVLQVLLGTGVGDVDDVIFNVLGALAGYGLHRLTSR